jgi:predicted permease
MTVDDELRHHIEERVDRLVASGMDPDRARRVALEHFGDLGAIRAELRTIDRGRDAGRSSLASRLALDLSFAFRQLHRRLAFAALAVGTLAAGIAASTAIFGLVKAVVLDPLPYPESDRLVVVDQVTPGGLAFSVSVADFSDARQRLDGVEHLSASRWTDVTYQADGQPIRVTAAYVTDDFFSLFGGEPQAGRTFSEPLEPAAAGPGVLFLDESVAVAPVVVVSHRFWRAALGGADGAVGRVVVLDGIPVTVVGVMPAGWAPLTDTDVYLPLPVDALRASRENHDFDVFGRLAPDVQLAAARTEADALARTLGEEHPETNEGWGLRLRPLKEAVVGEDRIRAGWMLLGAVGLLLLLACASVSNLLLARASTRGPEVGLRMALGASRFRLVQQFMTESLVVALVSAALGVTLASLALPVLRVLAPAGTPRIGEAVIDVPVLLVALGLSLATSVIFGLAPILHVSRHESASVLRGGPRGAGPAGGRARAALVGAQVAITVTLLAAAGLLASTFQQMRAVDTGLPVDTALSVPVVMSGPRYENGARQQAVRQIRERLEAIPGVAAAGTTNIVPFSGANSSVNVAVDGRVNTPESAPFVRWRAIGPGFFEAAAVMATSGRLFQAADFGGRTEQVVVLGESLARRLAGGAAEAVGLRIAMGWDGTNWRRVVGVVPDIEDLAVSDEAPLTFYFPAEGAMATTTFLVRLESAATVPPMQDIRRAIWEVEPALAVPTIDPLRSRAFRSVAAPRFNLAIVGIFGAVALVIAVMGVYGVTLFSVHQRRREIGVRIALGARPGGIVRMVLGRTLAIAGVGAVAGLGIALALAGTVESILFRTSPRNPWVLIAAAAVAGTAALAAAWLPARRAGATNPVQALRAD